jgi:ribose transport system permease protein
VNKLRSSNFGLDRFSAIYLFVGFIITFGIWSPETFLTSATVHVIASEQAVAGIVAVALLVPMTCGQFDLSIGGNANLTGIVAIILQTKYHWSVGPAILFALVVGVLVGVVNGLLVVRVGVSSFIATLGMSSVLSAVVVIVTGSEQPSPVTTNFWNKLTQYTIGGYQIVVLYLIIIGLVVFWLLDFTPVGRYFYAIGANREAARLAGVRVDKWSFTSLVISGGLSGLGGILYTSLTGPSLTFGSTLLLPAFAAAFLGSTQLQPGRFNVWGTLIAIYVLATGVQGLQLVSGAEWLGDMFNGVALILAVSLAVLRTRTRRSSSKRWRGRRRPVPEAGEHDVGGTDDEMLQSTPGTAS